MFNNEATVITVELLKQLNQKGVCILVQTGEGSFSFAPLSVANIDIVSLAKFLVSKGTKDSEIEKILAKFEGASHE